MVVMMIAMTVVPRVPRVRVLRHRCILTRPLLVTFPRNTRECTNTSSEQCNAINSYRRATLSLLDLARQSPRLTPLRPTYAAKQTEGTEGRLAECLLLLLLNR